MYWRIVISVFFGFFSYSSFSQGLDETYGLAEKYFESGDYIDAEKLYQRVAYFDSNLVYLNSYQRIAEIKLQQKEYSQAKSYFKLYSNWVDKDSIRVSNGFKVVLCCFMENNFKEAVLELLIIKKLAVNYNLIDKWRLHLAVAYFQDGDYNKSKALFSQLINVSDEKEFDKIFKKNNRLEKKFNRIKIQLMSAFLPGSGQVFTGNVGPGINSMVVVGGFLYLFTRVVRVLSVPDAILAVYPWLSRYYFGGVKKAALFADERIKIKRTQYYQGILQMVEENQ